MATPEQTSHLFLSYAREDVDLVHKLSEAIEAREWSVWVDRANIPSTSEWMAEIRRGIESADGFVFVLTPNSLTSRMCRVELSIAVDLSKRLIPLWVLDRAAWAAAEARLRERGGTEATAEVPPELAKLDYVDINDFGDRDDPFGALVDELLRAASRDLAWLRQHTRLQEDVKRWLDSRYSDSALLRGAVLVAAELMLSAEAKDPPLTPLQREFVQKSRAAYQSMLEREAGQLAHRILDLPPERIALGVMLALEGLETYVHTAQLEGALRTLMSRWPQLLVIPHESFVTSAAFGRDGAGVLTSSADGWLRWIDPASDEGIRRMGRAGVGMTKAAPTPDGMRAAAACTDGYVRVFDLATGGSTDYRVSDGAVDDLVLSADGQTIVAVSGTALTVIDLAAGRQYQLPPHPQAIEGAAFCGQTTVITTCKDGQVRLFQLDAQRWEEFGWSEGVINTVQLSPDGTWMVVAGSFEGAVVLDTKTRSVKHRLEIPGGSALALALSADGERIAVTNIWGRVFVFASGSGELLADKSLFSSYAWDVAMNHDGSLFAAASRDGRAVVCDVASGAEWLCAGHDGPVRTLTFDPTGSLLLTRGNDATVRMFAIHSVPGTATISQSETIIHADLSPDGALVATTARDGIVRMYDVATRALLAQYARQGETPVSATFASEDLVVAAYESGSVAFVNARSGTEQRSFASPAIERHCELRMTRDQRRLALRSFGDIVRILDPANGDQLELEEHERERIVSDIHAQIGFTGPGGRIVAREGGLSPVVEREGARIYLEAGEHQVIRAGFAPDGSVVVGAALNRTQLAIFDSADGSLVATLRLPHPANDARFSAQGTRIMATWLNAVSVVRYPSWLGLLEVARGKINRRLTKEERAEFGLPVEGADAGEGGGGKAPAVA